MRQPDIAFMYEYNYWANKRLLDTAASLSAEQFVAPGSFPYGGLRGTLVHILNAENNWRVFLQRVPEDFREFDASAWEEEDFKEADFPTVGGLAQTWAEEERLMRSYLADLDPATLDRVLRFQIDPGAWRERRVWHCLYHVVNHGTQHRSEAAALLTGFGCSPGDLDFSLFQHQYGLSIQSP